MSQPEFRVDRYSISSLPDNDRERDLFTIHVDRRGHDSWAVLLRGAFCLSVEGEWEYEHIPSDRTADWLAEHRFDLDDAMTWARHMLDTVVVNGMTVEDVIARREELRVADR